MSRKYRQLSTNYNQLLQSWPTKTVATQRWLSTQGIDRRQTSQWVQSGRLERLGHGAYKLASSTVDWPGAVYAIQSQKNQNVLLGAHSSIEAHGYAHNIALGQRTVWLFCASGTRPPAWFKNQQWSRPVQWVRTNMLSNEDSKKEKIVESNLNLLTSSEVKIDEVVLRASKLERAALEMFHLVPRRQSYEEAYQIMQSLTSLRPLVVQELLHRCSSAKTKRLFMHTAERVGHAWVKHVDLTGINFGSGRLTIHPGGKLAHKYNLVIDEPMDL